jgi:pimeloyl-ACP methyl ester carboxylesterase
MKAAPALRMPVFFFIGRHDHLVAQETSLAYFEILTAPAKKFVWFEESAHEPAVEEPAKFNALMVELVRPAATCDASTGDLHPGPTIAAYR